MWPKLHSRLGSVMTAQSREASWDSIRPKAFAHRSLGHRPHRTTQMLKKNVFGSAYRSAIGLGKPQNVEVREVGIRNERAVTNLKPGHIVLGYSFLDLLRFRFLEQSWSRGESRRARGGSVHLIGWHGRLVRPWRSRVRSPQPSGLPRGVC